MTARDDGFIYKSLLPTTSLKYLALDLLTGDTPCLQTSPTCSSRFGPTPRPFEVRGESFASNPNSTMIYNQFTDSLPDVMVKLRECQHVVFTVLRRHDYSIESVKVTITSGDGTAVYNENRYIDKSLLWMWRELLVRCEAHAFPTAPILMKMGQLNIMSKVFDRIRQNGDREGDANAGDVKFWDQHWDETMQNAAKRVCAARHAKQMSQFLKTPSLAVYLFLLQTNAIIRPVLTDTVRAHMADRSWVKLPLDWPEETEAAAVWDKMRLKEDSADPFGLPGLMKFLRFQLRRYTAVSDISRHFRCMAKVYSCMRQPGTFNPRLF